MSRAVLLLEKSTMRWENKDKDKNMNNLRKKKLRTLFFSKVRLASALEVVASMADARPQPDPQVYAEQHSNNYGRSTAHWTELTSSRRRYLSVLQSLARETHAFCSCPLDRRTASRRYSSGARLLVRVARLFITLSGLTVPFLGQTLHVLGSLSPKTARRY